MRLRRTDAEKRRRLDDKERPQPLAAAEAGVPHRVHHPLRTDGLALQRGIGQKAGQNLFGLSGYRSEPISKEGVRVV
jgi:hypothetical protein